MNFNATLVQNTPTNTNPTSISLNRQQVPNLVGFPFPDISNFFGVQGVSAVQRDWNTPYVQNWNFNIQQALANDFRLQVGYVANKGTHIITPGQNLNRFLPGTSIRPYPGFGDISYIRANGVSNYNSMQVVLTKRFPVACSSTSTTRGDTRWMTLPRSFPPAPMTPMCRLDYGTTESDVQTPGVVQLHLECRRQLPLPRWLAAAGRSTAFRRCGADLPINVMCGCDPLRVGQFNSRADYRPGGRRHIRIP